ncbi:MAG TPA: FGGY-family carbohydrate kinase, partial [Magnetospirillaceae bacterium]|nr:FGGY-family carbohydrate kinase [Magnetospirillaceae bacterium]
DPYYERYTWGGAAASALGLEPALFPPYLPPGRILGEVTREASLHTGIPQHIPVVTAFPDFLASLLGSGAVEPGIACDRAGTSEAFNLCAPSPCPDRSFLSLPHAVPGLWNISGGLSTSGKALQWFAQASGYPQDAGEEPLEAFRDAALSPPGARNLLFLPFLAGERAPLWKRDLRGAFLGLSMDHGREDLARGVAESIGFGLRLTSQGLAERGYPTRLVRMSGAPARNSFLSGIKADILGLPVEVPELTDCELAGNAAACAAALGDSSSLVEAAACLVRIRERYEPDPSRRSLYDKLYEIFSDSVAALAPISERLASVPMYATTDTPADAWNRKPDLR